MRCLVTGGLGFIGTHLVKRLRELGHAVTVLDNVSNPSNPLDVRDPYYERLGAENAGDIKWLASWPSDPTFEWVFHLAAVSRTPQAIANPLHCHAVNATGSLLLLDFVRRTCPKARVVLASSNIVYGSPNPYRASKLAMEEYMSAYNALYGLNCIALRYSNVYGPGMRWDDPICLASMRRSMVEKGYIELTGDGTQSRDFTHVSDIVEGTIAAAERCTFKGVVDLTSEQHRSMNQMAALMGCGVRFTDARPGDTRVIKQSGVFAFGLGIGKRLDQFVPIESGIHDVLAEIPQEVRA